MKNTNRSKILFFLLFLNVGLTLWLTEVMAGVRLTNLAQANQLSMVDLTALNCRYGASPLSGASAPWLSQLGAGWYVNFSYAPMAQAPNESAHVPNIRLREARVWNSSANVYDFSGEWYLRVNGNITGTAAADFIRAKVTTYPGRLWLIGNEIDRLTQDEITPEVYASAYHDIYGWIKETDPTAQVAISALVEVTPLRLAYLDRVWDAYQAQFGAPMPVDVWNMHLYIIPEVGTDGVTPSAASIPVGIDLAQITAVPKRESGGNSATCADPDVYCYAEHDDINIFEEQIRDMRVWMKARGEQNKPLILTEFSLLWPYEDDGDTCFLQDEYGGCFTPQRVSTFMVNAFDKLNALKDPGLGYPLDENRLVQQWMWFSIYATDLNIAGTASDLITETSPGVFTLTQMGQTFQTYVANEPTAANLLAERAIGSVAFSGGPITGTAVATATLSLRFRNVGNIHVNQPISITFYADAALTVPIDTVTTTVMVEGCAVRFYETAVSWPNLSPGAHQFWAKVDGDNSVSESNETDNVLSGIVLIDPSQTFLPVVKR